MKPVEKGAPPKTYTKYGQAKPDLLSKLGTYCSYCEAHKDPQDLDVEHIYPKDPHPELELRWENFLVACKSCNSYKNIHLGSARRKRLEKTYVWPHLDNTFRVFRFLPDGRVEIRKHLPKEIQKAGEKTRSMVGLLISPARAKKYHQLGIAYDGTSKREEIGQIATDTLNRYEASPNTDNPELIARSASKMGYFSIWMEVFEGHPDVRRKLIDAFKADSQCFNKYTSPVKRSRI